MERPFNHVGFHSFLTEGQLMGVRCQDCAAVYLPPRPLCPRCFGARMAWFAFSGRGVLIGHTTIYVGLSAMLEEGYSRERPYCTGVVRLEEGATIAGQMVDADCHHPEGLRVGEQVQAVFLPRDIGVSLGFERIRIYQE